VSKALKRTWRKTNDMVTSESPSILDLTVEDLLGWPLNDVEQKFAPGTLYVKGSLKIPLPKPRVSIVGSRKASQNGLLDAKLIAGILASKEVVIVSGLAEGIDTSAHLAAIGAASKTIAVLGTPLNKTFPAKNFNLQQEIMRDHLAISQFKIGESIRPNRNPIHYYMGK
jgi:DNA processing protein